MDQGSKSNHNRGAGCSRPAPQFLRSIQHFLASVPFWSIQGCFCLTRSWYLRRIPSSVSEKTSYLVMCVLA